MGVQGLTSFVNQRSDIYYECYQLSNSVLIIDGYGLASQLYNSSTKINSAFGGDYDKYCKIISNLFDIFKKCNIIPLVICDGGYEKKKLATVKKRNLHRVYSLEKVSPSSNNTQCFPLMMRHVFKVKLLEMSVPVFQTDFEADNEIAALARKLDVPVLSNDSDFFIYDVQYIPLTSMAFDCCENDGSNFYVPCQLFRVNNMLKSFGNLPKTMLPLLATVLGNDYIKSSKFKDFYSHLKMDKSKKMTPGQKRVKGLVNWLKDETFDSAMFKILQCLNKNTRRYAKKNIKNIIKGYTNLNTTLDDYIPNYISNRKTNTDVEVFEVTDSLKLWNIEYSDESEDENISSEKLSSNSNIEDSDNEENIFSAEEDEVSEEGEEIENNVELPNYKQCISIPPWLLHESRVGNVCPSIYTLLLLKVFFYCPQVEDYEYTWAGSITLPILQVIVGLLGLPSVSYWYRFKSRYVCSQLLPVNSISLLPFPELSVLNQLSVSDRKIIILRTLKVENFSDLEDCPLDWQLYLMSMVYWVKSNEDPALKHWHLHALIITMITVNVIGGKVGLFWNKKTFLKKYGTKLKFALKNNGLKKSIVEYKTIIEALENVTLDDCLVALESLISYFHVDEILNRNSRKFSRSVIHIYAQLQSTFELAVTLNSLLSQPFKRNHLGNFYNGTFLYNFTANFKNRTNILAYMESLLGKSPSILNLYFTVYKHILVLIPTAPKQVIKSKRPKKKKEINEKVNFETCVEELSEVEDFSDSNNRYSLLSKQNMKMDYLSLSIPFKKLKSALEQLTKTIEDEKINQD